MTIIAVGNLKEENIMVADAIAVNSDKSTYLEDKIIKLSESRYAGFMGNGILHKACSFLLEWALYRGYDLNLKSEEQINYIIKSALMYEDILEIVLGSIARTDIKCSTIYVIDNKEVFYWNLLADPMRGTWKIESKGYTAVPENTYVCNFFGTTPNPKECPDSFDLSNIISTIECKIDSLSNEEFSYKPEKEFVAISVAKVNIDREVNSEYSKIPYANYTDFMVSVAKRDDKKINELTKYNQDNPWNPF